MKIFTCFFLRILWFQRYSLVKGLPSCAWHIVGIYLLFVSYMSRRVLVSPAHQTCPAMNSKPLKDHTLLLPTAAGARGPALLQDTSSVPSPEKWVLTATKK